uniref:Thyroid stimulating hormone subunit beta n=1 Tax=Pundamilia nyererei TaxID=303518 RepID=A0A3B4GHV0_9CICH
MEKPQKTDYYMLSLVMLFSMPLFALKSLLLCVLMVGAVYTCMLKNYTLWIEKQDCTQCVAINTTICSGYCYTQVMMTYQTRSCVPLSLVYRAAHIPGCPKDVNPQLYYPAAHCCSCRRCDTRTHRCVRTSRIPYDQCFTTLDSVKKQNQSAVEISQYSNTSSSALARK